MSLPLRCLLAFTALSAIAESTRAEEPTEVIVTAQKRPEALSRTPLSVAVVTGDQMRNAGAHDIRDLQFLTSSLFVIADANEAQTTARLRGIGTVGDNPGLESSVGVVIDGVVRARTATGLTDLGQIERIEVLKGPQSDIYGKGASAGVINVITKAPDFKPAQTLELTAGNMGIHGLDYYATGALGKDVAGSFEVITRHRDGQYHVHSGQGPNTRGDNNDQNYWTMRGQLLINSNAHVTTRVIADYTRRNEACCAAVGITIGGTRAYIDQLAGAQGTAASIDPHARQVWQNRPTPQKISDGGLSSRTDVAFSDTLSLASITALRHFDQGNGYDGDFTSADVLYRDPDGLQNRFDTVSQELRLNWRGASFDAAVGIFADSETLTRRDETLYGSAYESYLSLLLTGGASTARVSQLTGLPAGLSYVMGNGSHDFYRQHEHNVALFTSGEWRVTDTVSAVAGLRYNMQTKNLTSAFTNSDGGNGCAHATGSLGVLCLPWSNPAYNNVTLHQSDSENAATGSLRLKWQITPQVMAYASYATGWKGAGYNLDREQNANFTVDTDSSFKAETSRSTELGVKGRLGALGFDIAAFDEAFRNFQLNTFLGTTFIVDSIPNLRSKGVEADGYYSIGRLKFNGGITYDQAKFGPEAVPSLPLIANGTASFAPKWSAAYGAAYSAPVGALVLQLNLNAKYNSAYNTGSDLNPIKTQKAYTLLNGRAAIADPKGAWSLELWGRNLTDVTYYQVAFAAPFQGGTYDAFLGQPKTYGVTLRLKR